MSVKVIAKVPVQAVDDEVVRVGDGFDIELRTVWNHSAYVDVKVNGKLYRVSISDLQNALKAVGAR